MKTLVSVTREELTKGYRFTGTFDDGTTEVIRKCATRPYTLVSIQKFSDRDPFYCFHATHNITKYHSTCILIGVVPVTAKLEG